MGKTQNGASCILWPEVNGKPSKLYKDMLDHTNNRPLTNLLYAAYEANPSVAQKLDAINAKKYNGDTKRDYLGQHRVNDVLDFFDYNDIIAEKGEEYLKQASYQIGAVDNKYKPIDYTNAKDALERADKFNRTHKGLVAIVIKHKDLNDHEVYNIYTRQKNSHTFMYPKDVENRLKVWEIYKQAFSVNGIDIENVSQEAKEFISPMNSGLVQQLINLKKYTRINDLYKKDAIVLFTLNQNTPQVQALIQRFGSIEDAAQAINDANTHQRTLTPHETTLFLNAVNKAKKFDSIDLNNLKAQVDQMTDQIITQSPEEQIRLELHKLNKKYKIDAMEFHRIGNSINTLSDAAQEIIINLERQIKHIKDSRTTDAQERDKNIDEGRKLSKTLSTLYQELRAGRYYSGTLSFLNEVNTRVAEVDKIVDDALTIPPATADLEFYMDRAKKLYKITLLHKQYYDILKALANDSLIIDENISQQDIDNIRTLAQKIKKVFDNRESQIKSLTSDTVREILIKFAGDGVKDITALVNAIDLAVKDSTKQDSLLYAMSRVSNPIISTMGGLINDAQLHRNDIMAKFSTRITKATKKLYASGSNSEFMYEDDGHIISDIDWKAYYAARAAYKKALNAQNLDEWDFRQALYDWEDNNTEGKVVDATNGRTEKIPNQRYRKAFPQLTKEQQEYYDTMMQIKGEIGSLLPEYARHQYLPPQLRRNMFDALGHAKGFKDVKKAVLTKAQNLYKIREDDENYNTNGVIEGEEYATIRGDYDNTQLKQIPIFFVNKVEQGELLKDFSGGLQALAGTAINYSEMSRIEDCINFMGDYIKNYDENSGTRDEQPKAETFGDRSVRIIKDLRSWAVRNHNTEAMVDSFINQHLYGVYRDPNENKTWRTIASRLISYTSFKGLATNLKGMTANYLMGEFQMLIEAGAGEFYGFKDYAWAHTKLFGSAGVTGEIWDLLNETKNSKSRLFAELFDPEQENFDSKTHTRYHKNILRKLFAHDLSFMGYGAGEYLIHYVGMYACLHHQKVYINGEKMSLYDAFEVVNKGDGAAELHLKQGITDKDGNPIDPDELLRNVRKKIQQANQTCHGAMDKEHKGLIYQHWYGAMAMNFRQWMVEHYSRRFRKKYFDANIGQYREGYWRSLNRALIEEFKENKEARNAFIACLKFLSEVASFTVRGRLIWASLDDVQKYNLGRAHTELSLLLALYVAEFALSFVPGGDDDFRGNRFARFWLYQLKRLILDTEASMPHPAAIQNMITILQSPMASISTANSMLYTIYGLGDITETIQSGPHKGENKYLRNVIKYDFPFVKDIEQMETMKDKDDVFKAFKITPSGY
jgi:hypothetical protein